MPTVLGGIARQVNRRRLNIITFTTHEPYQNGWSGTDADFYLVQAGDIRPWNKRCMPLPPNHFLLNGNLGDKQIPSWIDFDLVISQNKFGQIQIAKQIANSLRLPLISIEHTLPHKSWDEDFLTSLRSPEMSGDFNVFISEFSKKAWGWESTDAHVINHGINSSFFNPGEISFYNRNEAFLSVVNDWKNRDWCCGYKFWEEATYDIKTIVVGDNPGLSLPAESPQHLAQIYRNHKFFLNTSLISPVPTALLEAMCSGCVCISTNTCMIPEIITHGENGFLCETPQEMNRTIKELTLEPELCYQVSLNARRTIEQMFSMKQFVENYNTLFQEAAS